jgi:UDP-N-acetylglucosamine acyltransferase
MAYCHVAHDCTVGDDVIMANGVQLAGHVAIEDFVIIGGLVPVHQFCTVGQHSFIGGGFRVTQDVPPYILAAGYPISYKGLNIVGLKRRGFSPEAIAALRRAYRFIYRSKLNTTKALDKIQAEVNLCPEVQNVIDFIQRSERGLIR